MIASLTGSDMWVALLEGSEFNYLTPARTRCPPKHPRAGRPLVGQGRSHLSSLMSLKLTVPSGCQVCR